MRRGRSLGNRGQAGWLVVRGSGSAIAGRVGESFDLAPVRIQLAGRVTVEAAHTKLDERSLYGSQARRMFVMLVVERDRPVSRDELAEVLWPDELPRTWAAALRGVVSKVRAFLAAAGLSESATTYDGFGAYQLHLPADTVVDIEFASAAVETAEQMLREHNFERAITLAEHARTVALRPFLLDVKNQWADGIRRRLREVLLWALYVLSDGYAQRGRYQLAARTAEDAIALEPFRERAHQLLMRAHAAAGNPAEALLAYDRCRRLLAQELGVDPTAETAALHLALLQNGKE
jgi:DNA-binding SARP family transcriptional activator